MFWGNYDELYIVSPESSPAASVADSSESRKTGLSPESTFTRDSRCREEEEEIRGGAAED